MGNQEQPAGWNSFARTNASERWRKPSAMMGTPLTELSVREADVQPHMRVLDIACGTGEPAISIASLLGGTGEVVASDISESPLKIAQQRAQQRGLSNISCRMADVHRLPFEDEQFDRVTCRLGLMFFKDVQGALREIRRVLKPGGKFIAVVWGPMQQPYFETTIGTILKMNSQLELPKSGAAMFKFGEQGTLTRELKAAGFAEATDEVREVDWTWHGTPQDVWEYFQAVTIPFSPLIQAVPKERRAETDSAVIASMAKYTEGDRIHFHGKFVLAKATR